MMELKTERLILRKFSAGDAQEMFDNWAGDPEVSRHLTWDTHKDTAVTKKILEEWSAGYLSENFYQWGIVFEGKLIGSVGGHDVDKNEKTISFGYCIGRKWWGKGIMTEAFSAVVDHWKSLGFKRIWGVHHVDNHASGRVMEKSGLKFEGLIKHVLCGDREVKQYAIDMRKKDD